MYIKMTLIMLKPDILCFENCVDQDQLASINVKMRKLQINGKQRNAVIIGCVHVTALVKYA